MSNTDDRITELEKYVKALEKQKGYP